MTWLIFLGAVLVIVSFAMGCKKGETWGAVGQLVFAVGAVILLLSFAVYGIISMQ